MGADMMTMTVTIPTGVEPDWDSAALGIRALPLEALWGTADDLFPLEYWIDESGRLREMERFPSAEAAFWSLASAQQDLNRGLCLLRGVLEFGWPEEVVDFTAVGHRVLFTGGPSWGEAPGDLISPLIYLGETGVLEAAGFDGFTAYVAVPLDQRTFAGDPSACRRAEFGAAAARVLSLVAPADESPDGSLLAAFDRSVAELEDAAADDQLAALVSFAADGLLLSHWLRRSDGTADEWSPRQAAGELVRLADEDDLDLPRRRSAAAAVRAVRKKALDLRYWLWAIDDPEGHSDEAVQHLLKLSGTPLGTAVDVLLTQPLYTAIAAIADLGFDWQTPGRPPVSVAPVVPGPSETRFAPLAEYQSLMLVDEANWQAAELEAGVRLSGAHLAKALEDLEDIRTFLGERPYDRFATIDAVSNQWLLIGSPESEARPDIAHAIGRLGRGGLLRAAGVSWWSAPDPEFRGPVETFVPGYGPR